jgi:hypothetical protein
MGGFCFMVEIILISLLVVAVLVAGAALLAAGTFYGRLSVQGPVVEAAQARELESTRQLRLWQEKLLRQTGVGPLQTPAPTPQPPARRFVPPSVAIAEMQKQDATGLKPHVPGSIAQEFIQDVGGAARPVARRIR